MNYNKKIIIAVGIFFSAVLIGLSAINIAINFMYPGNEIAESIKENFKDSFGKAIKFDSLVFKYNGDIILQNFYLSNTTDFNDNVNLIKCGEVIIDTYLPDLLREKITFSAVIMYNPEINVIKSYGKSYTDTFINDIATGFKNDKIDRFITRKFVIELIDSQLAYREIFKKSKTSVDLYDVDIDMVFNGNVLKYELDGKIVNNNISKWKRSGFDAEGSVLFNEGRTSSRISFKNIDISIINNHLTENYNKPLFCKGVLSGNIIINTDNENLNLTADIEGNNIFASENDGASARSIIKNENISVKTEIAALSSLDNIKINKLIINDGIVDLSINSEFVKDEFLALTIQSNSIDLSELSYRFCPVRKSTYNGILSVNGKLTYNLKDLKPDELAIDIKLNQFNLIPFENSGSKFEDIKNCNAILTADREKLFFKAELGTVNTDLEVSYDCLISQWNPFKSKSQMEISSGKMELALIKDAVVSGINAIYDMAYVDMFQNFDEQRNFLKEPEGIFVNNNDFVLKIKADKLVIKNGSALDNFNLVMNLDRGVVKTELFTLEGYEGIFNFNAYATFRQDYPFIKIEGGVDNLNIAKISVDSDSAINGAGILSSDFKFETNAFRIGQIVENGRASFNLGIRSGFFSGTDSLKKLDNFLKNNGYSQSLPEPLAFDNLTFSFVQSAYQFYIRNFQLSGNKCNFVSHGKYEADDGLSIPVTLNINTDNNYTRVPLFFFGKLLTPCVKINEKNKPDYICF